MEKKDLVRETLDVRHYRSELLIYLVFIVLSVAVCFFGLSGEDTGATFFAFFVAGIVSVCAVAWDVYRLMTITRAPERYEEYEAFVTEAHHSMLSKHGMYVTIEIETDNGTVTVDSAVIFSRSFLSSRYYRNVLQRNVKVLYDRTTRSVLILSEGV